MGSAADCYFCGSARVALMGNGVCNSECYIGACNLDGGDCNVCGDFGCLTSQIGDGICQKECFNFGCEYDQEDCFTCIDSPDCSPRFIGDGTLVGPSFFLHSFFTAAFSHSNSPAFHRQLPPAVLSPGMRLRWR